ncbi:PREDICTED: homeobox-leucine zipper protein ATHB-6-like [Nicotiana attenuata]|uniref:Homeobox-leucine zipper protein n=1 Tax=Nicotiana attenuata TaxID=49451 RepID=A0A314L585_NICAT|nr:PREDICTED: homeobox-leucine zipper protein ATHB-6-like [Nicotiana attenuata]OIT36682.1 homeobox-leucine zipper protein athb-5 [Nicotiana attenuata]
MKRFSFSDSSGKLLYPPEEKNRENLSYSTDFQAMLDGLEDEDGIEESGCVTGKKRRLKVDQVQALEKIFEVDNKLDPERKVKIAQELGLQPRQVAIWFQNRRARWKTKQLERDYNILKANYETLQLNYSKVEQEKEGLINELKGLKEKIGEENSTAFQRPQEILELNPRNYEVNNKLNSDIVDSKDGSSDSDSSGVMNEENYNNTLNYQPLMPKVSSYNALDHLSLSSTTYTQLLDPRASSTSSMRGYHQQHQVGKMEEQIGFTTEDSCNIYSVDQAPNLYWYLSDHRN